MLSKVAHPLRYSWYSPKDGAMPNVDPIFVQLSAGFVAFVWISSALPKLSSLSRHRLTVEGYGLLPSGLVPVFSFVQPALELSLGLAVLLPAARVPAAWSSLGLLSVYSLAIGINLARGRRDIDCGCSGPAARQELTEGLVLRNIALIAICAVAALPVASRNWGWIDFATLSFGIVGMVMAYTAANYILAQAPVSRLIGRH